MRLRSVLLNDEFGVGIGDEGYEHGGVVEMTVAVTGVIGAVGCALENQRAEQIRDADRDFGSAPVVNEANLHAAFHGLRSARHGQHRRAGNGRVGSEELGQMVGDQQIHDVAVRSAHAGRVAGQCARLRLEPAGSEYAAQSGDAAPVGHEIGEQVGVGGGTNGQPAHDGVQLDHEPAREQP